MHWKGMTLAACSGNETSTDPGNVRTVRLSGSSAVLHLPKTADEARHRHSSGACDPVVVLFGKSTQHKRCYNSSVGVFRLGALPWAGASHVKW